MWIFSLFGSIQLFPNSVYVLFLWFHKHIRNAYFKCFCSLLLLLYDYTVKVILMVVQWLRLTLSNGPIRADASYPFTWGRKYPVSEILCSWEYRRRTGLPEPFRTNLTSDTLQGSIFLLPFLKENVKRRRLLHNCDVDLQSWYPQHPSTNILTELLQSVSQSVGKRLPYKWVAT